MNIILQHPKGHDHGEYVNVPDGCVTYCEGFNDGDKEYIFSGDEAYERYSCYSAISPYGWKKSDKKQSDFFS